MALYERNSIQQVDLTGKEGVYASFVCEDDGTYDYLLLEEVSKAVIVPMKVDIINKATCKNGKTEISFVCEFNKDIDPINVNVSAIINDHKATAAKIEIQDFTDALCETIYENSPFEEHEAILEVKRKAVEELMRDFFAFTGEILADKKYDFVGRVVNTDNEVVAIDNSFETSLSEDNEFIINLNDVVSYVSLKDINVSKIEFFTGHYIFVINNFDTIGNTEGIIRQYKLKVTNCYSVPSNEPIIAETNNNILDYDFYFDERAEMLASRESIFNINNSDQNIVSDLFADFDF